MTTEYPAVGDRIVLTTSVFGATLPAGTELIVRRVDPGDVEAMPVVADHVEEEPLDTPGPLGFGRVVHHVGVPLALGEFKLKEHK